MSSLQLFHYAETKLKIENVLRIIDTHATTNEIQIKVQQQFTSDKKVYRSMKQAKKWQK